MTDRPSRRRFLAGLSLASVAAAQRLTVQAASMRVGDAAITWGGNDELAIREVSEVGFKGIQLRSSAVDRWGTSPASLRDLLAQKHLTLAVLSSGLLRIDPAVDRDELAAHVA